MNVIPVEMMTMTFPRILFYLSPSIELSDVGFEITYCKALEGESMNDDND